MPWHAHLQLDYTHDGHSTVALDRRYHQLLRFLAAFAAAAAAMPEIIPQW